MEKKGKKIYADEVVHFDCGVRSYVCRIDTYEEHPMGPGWWRLLDPCFVRIVENGNKSEMSITPIDYPQKNYRKHIDIYVPPDAIIEILTLDKNGERYKVYKKVMELPRVDKIVAPGMANIVSIGKGTAK